MIESNTPVREDIVINQTHEGIHAGMKAPMMRVDVNLDRRQR